MNGTETLSVDLTTLLTFTMPGFFFVWTFKRKKGSDFEYFIFSMFWGIILYGVFYYFLPIGNLIPSLKNPLVGAIAFSFIGMLMGGLLNQWTNHMRH